MKAARSSGHGMDLTAGRNGVPASCPGVQIRQDSFERGAVPKFSLCTDGKNWFQNQGRWQGAGSMPSPGAIIFFDWDHDGTCDHVGIVERCDGTTVYTVEGNSGDAVRERSYAIRSDSIMGYGWWFIRNRKNE